MNRAFASLLSVVLLALLANSVSAAMTEEKPAATPAVISIAAPAAPFKPDAAKGASLYGEGDAARGLPACISCHGAAGNSAIPGNPKLAGQHPAYLYKQLTNFTGPDRNQAIMTLYAKMLTDEEKKNIAAYLGAQVIKPGAAKDKDTLEFGKKIYRGGIAEKNIPACASCHGAGGAGVPNQYPRMGGQHQDYTAAQLALFRSGARKNSIQMSTIAKRMTDDEMKAVSDYIAGLK